MLKTTETHSPRRISRVDKWLAMGVMERVDQVRCIAEMLDANMGDLYDQMEELSSMLDCLQEGTDTIQERIEELTDLIEGKAAETDDLF